MKNFNSAAVRGYLTGEHLEFLNYVLDVYKEADIAALKLNKRVDDLQDAVSALEAVFQNPTGMDNTESVKKLDQERLQILSATRLFLLSITKRKDAEKANLANNLLVNMQFNCDKIASRSAPQKTAKIKAFIKDVTTIPELTAAVSKLDLAEEIAELDKTNIAFYTLHKKNVLSKKEPSTTSQKRAKAKAQYDLLIRDTQSYANVTEDNTAYENIITEVNKIIDSYNAPIKLRQSMRKKSKNASPTVSVVEVDQGMNVVE